MMTYNKRLFTSESVTEGHPDKIADQVSDAILDEILKDDPNARVACETTVTTGMALISGEISTTTYVDIPKVVRETIKDIGYTRAKYGYDSQTMAVLTAIDEQSPDIAQGVDKALEYRNEISEEEIEATGAGDQGLMFGYATDETDTYMPLPIFLSHQLAKRLSDVRKDEILDYLRPDGKVQVTVEYDEDDQPRRIDTIVVSTQHAEDVELAQIEKDIKTHVIYPTVDKALLDEETKFYINPTGRFVIGGPQGDAGLTGRKIIVDTYGGYARHGGGCFSGKDPTKVDRSAAYAARYVAKNIVAAGLAKQCEVQLAYAIGVAEPVSISINTFDTGKVSEARLVDAVRKHFDLRPAGIIKMLDLKQPIYKQTAAYGHFGRTDVLLPWEKLDKVNLLKDAVEIQ
ncbi:methionine adenosyltransferase [Staphylococcus epidermidis W23144]|nr:methionine adenosyltransferase [Staphylococcus epidermidis W23144]